MQKKKELLIKAIFYKSVYILQEIIALSQI